VPYRCIVSLSGPLFPDRSALRAPGVDAALTAASRARAPRPPPATRAVDLGCRVPRLEHILERFPDARLVIDPKTDRGVVPLAALLDRFAAWERVCVGAFSDLRLARIRRLGRGRACTSMGPGATAIARAASVSGRLPRLGADCLQVPIRHGPVPLVTERFVCAAHRARLPVQVWTIDDAPTMRRLLDLGADAIMTNRPALAFEILGT